MATQLFKLQSQADTSPDCVLPWPSVSEVYSQILEGHRSVIQPKSGALFGDHLMLYDQRQRVRLYMEIRYINIKPCFLLRYPLNHMRRDDLGHRQPSTEAEETFRMLATILANSHSQMQSSGSCGDHSPSGAIHGVTWNHHKGALMDYLFFRHGTLMVCEIHFF